MADLRTSRKLKCRILGTLRESGVYRLCLFDLVARVATRVHTWYAEPSAGKLILIDGSLYAETTRSHKVLSEEAKKCDHLVV